MRNLKLSLAIVMCSTAVLAISGAFAEEPAHSDPNGSPMTELEIELPDPNFGGTPCSYMGPNLEISILPRGPFHAPSDTVLLSKGKPVTSSDITRTPERLAMITDGDKRWHTDSVVLLRPGVQHVQIDLETPCELSAIVLWHFHEYERVYFDVIVQVSNDPDFRQGVTTLYNNDHDRSAGLGLGTDKEYIERNDGRLVDGKATNARYVRLYSQGNTSDDGNTYIEVDVYGRPANSE